MDWSGTYAVLLVMLVSYGGAAAIIGSLFLGRFSPFRKKRKSPFTSNFLRAPGQTLGEKVDDIRTDVLLYMMIGAWGPTVMLAGAFGHAYIAEKRLSWVTVFLYGTTILIGLSWLGRKTYKLGRDLRQQLLGYEGEVAVGQELNQLMAHRFRVYHDFPADGFNIDHVVIGPTGVFAVETKARAKPDTGDGKKDAHLVFDGQRLCFPGWTETAPLEQAQRQANWLHQWIQRSAAESVPVVPVLALPGWFVDRKKSGAVLLSSGRDVESVYLRYNRTPGLNPQQIQRIAHQVEGRCRNITPRVYRKSEKAMARR